MTQSLFFIGSLIFSTLLYSILTKKVHVHDHHLDELLLRVKKLEKNISEMSTPSDYSRLTKEYTIVDTDDQLRVDNSNEDKVNVSQYEI
jgi:hypothetical protein